MIYLLNMVIFNSHAKLPKGKPSSDWGSPHFDGPQGRLLIAASCRILPCCGPCFPRRMVSTCDMATGSVGPSIMTIIRTMYNHKNINSTKHVIIMYNNIMKRRLIITSSTAQGGGGSFKNRKLIGAVGCCESRMAERSH